MTRIALAAVLLAALPLSTAAAESGVYVGVGSGEAEIRDQNAGFTARNPLYRGFVGYRASAPQSPLPFLDVAAEAGYIDYGRSSQTAQGQSVQYHLHGFHASGLLLYPLGPLDLYGKAGVLFWSSYRNTGGATTDRSGNNALYGGGIAFRIGKIGIRTEYERYNVSDVDRVQTYSASVLIQF